LEIYNEIKFEGKELNSHTMVTDRGTKLLENDFKKIGGIKINLITF
jgi:hypothetical protein